MEYHIWVGKNSLASLLCIQAYTPWWFTRRSLYARFIAENMRDEQQTAHSIGVYSAWLMCVAMEEKLEAIKSTMDILWRNAAPPRVQFFGWLAYLDKVNMADLFCCYV